MSTDFEKDRTKKFTPVTFFKNNLPLSQLYHNLEPFLMRRTASDFVNFCGIFVLQYSNSEYKRVLDFIHYFCQHEKLGKGKSYNLLDNKGIELKTKSYYILDLRSKPDSSLDPIVIENKDKVPPFVLNQVCINLLNNVRGVFVFADSYKDVPISLYARSQFGLSEENELDLHHFVFKGSNKLYNSQPEKQDNKLYGYINCEKWPTMVYF